MSVYSTTSGEITTFTVSRSRRRAAVVQQIETFEHGHKVRRQRSCEVSQIRWCDTFFPLLGGFLHTVPRHPDDIAAARHIAANLLIVQPFGPPVRVGDPLVWRTWRRASLAMATLNRVIRQAELMAARIPESH